ncbi:MAG: hypothetical protein FJ296_11035, partial [Planctomycetes bacterium]|nr:hypothetical protein [Planctomycetota bacterium]
DEAPPPRTAEEETLAALGYAAFTEEPDPEPGLQGVVLHDRERSRAGWDMVMQVPLGRAELFDPDGQLQRTWRVEQGAFLSRAELLPDGDVLLCSSEGDPADRASFVARLAWDGTPRWRAEVPVHHDVELTPRGQVLALCHELRPDAVAGNWPSGFDEVLMLLDAGDGRVLERLSLWDLLRSDPDAPPLIVDKRMLNPRGPADLLHANSVEWMPWPDLAGRDALHGAACVLVSLRHQSLVLIVDWDRRDLAWAWGQGELVRQHEATWLPDGQVLLFDNGDETRRWSRVLTVDPAERRITWEFRAPTPGDFYSRGRGTAQGLPGGNVLVASSNQGEAFEVTREGRVVWRWRNPARDPSGRLASFRMRRYEPAYVEAILRRAAEGR